MGGGSSGGSYTTPMTSGTFGGLNFTDQTTATPGGFDWGTLLSALGKGSQSLSKGIASGETPPSSMGGGDTGITGPQIVTQPVQYQPIPQSNVMEALLRLLGGQ